MSERGGSDRDGNSDDFDPQSWRLISVLFSSQPLSPGVVHRLARTAFDLYRSGESKRKLKETLCEGEVCDLGHDELLGSISGRAFEAHLETEDARVERAERYVKAAQDDLLAVRVTWEAWLQDAGLAESRTPRGALDEHAHARPHEAAAALGGEVVQPRLQPLEAALLVLVHAGVGLARVPSGQHCVPAGAEGVSHQRPHRGVCLIGGQHVGIDLQQVAGGGQLGVLAQVHHQAITLLFGLQAAQRAQQQLEAEHLRRLRLPQAGEAQVRSAYVYAFPLMMTDALMQVTSAIAPNGRFMHQRTLEDEALPAGVRARVDVLASSAFVDLRNGLLCGSARFCFDHLLDDPDSRVTPSGREGKNDQPSATARRAAEAGSRIADRYR